MPLSQRDFFTAQDYWALPEGTRAELIEGELYNMAPPNRKHQEIVSGLIWLLCDYIQRKGIIFYFNSSDFNYIIVYR